MTINSGHKIVNDNTFKFIMEEKEIEELVNSIICFRDE